MLVNETVLLPGFSLIGFIFGSYVLIKKYKNEFVGDKDTYDNRLVLAYDIMTTLFITIGIGLSLTFGSIYLSRNECQPLTCVQLMSDFKDKTIELTAANNDILTLEATLNDLRSRLEARLPNSGSEWIMRASYRIVEIVIQNDNRGITTDEVMRIIEEEFVKGP